MLNINKADLKQGGQFFVFEKFDFANEAQIYVSSTANFVYGLPIMIKIIEKNEPVIVKESNNVIYNTAFNGMTLCASNVSTSEKKLLKSLVERMNGRFEKDFIEETTHLVTNTTKSKKYEGAVLQGIKVFHVDWIKRVYRDSTVNNCFLKADSAKFQSFLLPPFCDLKITTTEVPIAEKNQIKESVEGHGGKFEEVFSREIDILIVGKNVTYNVKYQMAQELKIPCLKTQWIFDSISSNYALSYNKYFVRPKRRQSDPKYEDYSQMIPSDVEDRMSQDMQAKAKITAQSSSQMLAENETEMKEPFDISSHFDTDLSQATIRNAGTLFDGVIFFIYDFSFIDYKQLKKRLTTCGAFCTNLDQHVTHIVCNAVEKNGLKHKELFSRIENIGLHSTPVVKLDWIVDCIREKKMIALRKEYIYEKPQTPSSLPNRRLNQENDGNKALQKNKMRAEMAKPLAASKFPNQTPPIPMPKRKLPAKDEVTPKKSKL